MMRSSLGRPKQLAVRGVAAIVFGVLTLIWPDVTLWTLVVLWGAYALVDGTIALSNAITDRYLLHRGWVAAGGIGGILAGVLTFVWPGITALALLYVIAAWALFNGFTLIGIAIGERKRLTGEWVLVLDGILSVLFGLVLLVSPGAGALAITWAIGWWACASGGVSLWMAWRTKRELEEVTARRSTAAAQPHLVG